MNNRHFLVFVVLFLVSACSSSQQSEYQKSANIDAGVANAMNADASDQYVSGSDDIPLADGLYYVPEESSNFDTMTGSIITSSYRGNVDPNSIRGFYLQTLPQLGWKLMSDSDNPQLAFVRAKSKLEINFRQDNGLLFVKFFMSPSNIKN